MPEASRANGLWHGPVPKELRDLNYCEAKVINLARIYVSVKRIFLDRQSYARTSEAEAPRYHQKNVVAYPQNPDTALRAIGMNPSNLAKMVIVQFVGENRQELRQHGELSVSVEKLRKAFQWLSMNSWPFMEATKQHDLWSTGLLDQSLEELLHAYTQSIGSSTGGMPSELFLGATRIAPEHAGVHAAGPADCVDDDAGDEHGHAPQPGDDETKGGNNCAAALDGGVDDLVPVQLWDTVMTKYKVAQQCDAELQQLDAKSDLSEREQLQRKRLSAVAEAVGALAKLHHRDTEKKLREFVQRDAGKNATLVIPHSDDILKNRDPLFWFSCFVRLFPRGDCAERCVERLTHLPSWRWAKTLLTRIDFPLRGQDVEFVATLYNVFLRRDQVRAVELSVASSRFSAADLAEMQTLSAAGLVACAMSSGEVTSVRELLRKKTLNTNIEITFRKMQIIQRKVRGSEAEKEQLLPKFTALRLWSGCSSLFFTLNPHDIRSPITMTLLQGVVPLERTFSLDFNDAEAAEYVRDFCHENPRRLHELVAGNPLAATRCFHWTVRLVIRALFSCDDKPGSNPNNIPANTLPGIFGHVRAYLGVVEPQMRKALHIHMLIQLLGFAHPQDIFGNNLLPDTFRRLWYYVASIAFRSTEAFADYLHEEQAMIALSQEPLLPLTNKQRGMIGEERVRDAQRAQLRARGLREMPQAAAVATNHPSYVTSTVHADATVSADTWAAHVVKDIAQFTRKVGNHVCRPDVCHKGRLGKRGFCRMFFWHWARHLDTTKGLVAKMCHGLRLHSRWDGRGAPPLHDSPPFAGLPAVETTHPFHFKLCPSMLLGPYCNHDLGILLRLPTAIIEEGTEENARHAETAERGMLEAMGDHEFYCASYSSKDSPHIEGLLTTLADGLRAKERDIAAAREVGEEITSHEVVRRILHRLISSTNRRMHKGFPEMLTYLLQKPMDYCSHKFRHVQMERYLRRGISVIKGRLGQFVPEPRAEENDLKPNERPDLWPVDYAFRPSQLESFPLYFFLASCVARTEAGSGTMSWKELPSPAGPQRQRSYVQEPVKSRTLPEFSLLDASKNTIHKYGFYVHLLTDTAWNVPVLYCRMPRVPDASAKPMEKGFYGLFLMILFRSHRRVEDLVHPIFTREGVPGLEDDAWVTVDNAFQRWKRDEVDRLAAPYVTKKAGVGRTAPTFGSDEWWACAIYEKLRNYEAAMRKHNVEAYAVPQNLSGLPDYKLAPGLQQCDEEKGAAPPDNESDSSLEPAARRDCPEDEAEDFPQQRPRVPGSTAEPLATRCGELPTGSRVEDFHDPPLRTQRRNCEGRYWQDFAAQARETFPKTYEEGIALARPESLQIDTADALAAVDRQKAFFQSVDKFEENVDAFEEARAPVVDTSAGTSKDNFDKALHITMTNMPTSYARKSDTIVMEAAFYLIEQGLLNIPDVGGINVKQARAFLWNAAWLQEYMLAQWREAGDLPRVLTEPRNPRNNFKNFCLAIMGAGGTGKTAVLKITEALTIFFAGIDTVRKLAPSNAAARLLGGDTIHALCRLPFGKARLTSKRGRLANSALQRHRKLWGRAVAAYVDEISMVSADQLCQCDVRLRQAKMTLDESFGGLAMNLCGDFLQLPPVDKDGSRRSLAKPLDDAGYYDEEEEEEGAVDEEFKLKKQAQAESRQGFELWRSVRRVVVLNVNVRAPGVLSRLQAEMRAGYISNEMWDVYRSRIMTPNDPRLTDPTLPHSQGDIRFIVHRHRIRVLQSLDNAKAECRKHKLPLYVLQARDEAIRSEDVAKLTQERHKELLRRVNPEQTKSLPSFLPLYRGMRLVLASKDCVRFGIMKGCPCILRDIIFAENEALPYAHVAGAIHELTYMPISLLLQAEDAQWTLRRTELPDSLAANVDRRGLFQLRPSYDYLRVLVENDYITVRRTSFLVTPADTITVYAAQGSTYDAVVADMQRPPNLEFSKHWLACYVMISRARSIDGLLVLRPATREELSARPPQYLLDELERLASLEATSHEDLLAYIDALPMEVPPAILGLLARDAPAAEVRRVRAHRDGTGPTHRLHTKTQRAVARAKPSPSVRAERHDIVPNQTQDTAKRVFANAFSSTEVIGGKASKTQGLPTHHVPVASELQDVVGFSDAKARMPSSSTDDSTVGLLAAAAFVASAAAAFSGSKDSSETGGWCKGDATSETKAAQKQKTPGVGIDNIGLLLQEDISDTSQGIQATSPLVCAETDDIVPIQTKDPTKRVFADAFPSNVEMGGGASKTKVLATSHAPLTSQQKNVVGTSVAESTMPSSSADNSDAGLLAATAFVVGAAAALSSPPSSSEPDRSCAGDATCDNDVAEQQKNKDLASLVTDFQRKQEDTMPGRAHEPPRLQRREPTARWIPASVTRQL